MTNENTDSTVPVLLTDVATAAQLIDICSKRGAFKAEELSVVGNLFTRLVAHLPTQPAEEANDEEVPQEQLEFNFSE